MPGGRRSKLTPEAQKGITDAITLGATYELAAQYGGVTYQTFLNWMARGEQATRGKYFEFFEAVKSAEGQAVVRWLGRIEQAAKDGTWQAAAWKLERRYPQSYGRQVHELDVSDKAAATAAALIEAMQRGASRDTDG